MKGPCAPSSGSGGPHTKYLYALGFFCVTIPSHLTGAFMIRLGTRMDRWSGWIAICAAFFSTLASAAPADFTNVAMQRHTAGTYYIDGAIRGYGDLRMLVDTGSSYLVIGDSILAHLKASGGAQYSRDL